MRVFTYRAMSGIKKFFIYTFVTIALAGATSNQKLYAYFQTDPGETFNIVQRAISKGDVRMISKYTSAYTEMSILGATTTYSRAQAAYILKAFFKQHPPEQFAFQHKLRVGKDWFIHGRYRNRDGRPYRLEMMLRWSGQRFEIKSINIRQE